MLIFRKYKETELIVDIITNTVLVLGESFSIYPIFYLEMFRIMKVIKIEEKIEVKYHF